MTPEEQIIVIKAKADGKTIEQQNIPYEYDKNPEWVDMTINNNFQFGNANYRVKEKSFHKAGYYYVKLSDYWTIGYYDDGAGYWRVIGVDHHYCSKDFKTIGYRIYMPGDSKCLKIGVVSR